MIENHSDGDVEMDSLDSENSIPEDLPQQHSDEGDLSNSIVRFVFLHLLLVPNAALNRPSDYLRDRCPLCFGGENWAKPSEV